MMVLTSAVLMSGVYFGTIEIERQQTVETSQALSALLGHRQQVMQYVLDHRNTLSSGKLLTTNDLADEGVTGLSEKWQAYWDGKQFLYLYPAGNGAEEALLEEIREATGYSMFLGTMAKDADGDAELDSQQSSGTRMRLPGALSMRPSGTMVWAIPLPLT